MFRNIWCTRSTWFIRDLHD